MVQIGTILSVSDNSGAKKARCIKVYGRKVAGIGHYILVSVQSTIARQKSKAKKGSMYRALVTECVKNTSRRDGSYFSLQENKIILLSNQNQPLASRLTGILTNELRGISQSKLLTLSNRTL